MVTHECPNCGGEIERELHDGEVFECPFCRARFKVLLDQDSGRVGFIDPNPAEASAPLFLPRGSIRALITIAMALCCWIIIFLGNEVPGYLLSLLATIVGYYFAFRKRFKTAQSRIFDASPTKTEPLFLPHGFIRFFLIAGFVACGIVLLLNKRLRELHYLEFFVVLFGLIVGYLFSKILAHLEGSRIYVLVNHVKGALVLCGAGYLAYLLVSGDYVNASHLALVLSSVISFYFGSRS